MELLRETVAGNQTIWEASKSLSCVSRLPSPKQFERLPSAHQQTQKTEKLTVMHDCAIGHSLHNKVLKLTSRAQSSDVQVLKDVIWRAKCLEGQNVVAVGRLAVDKNVTEIQKTLTDKYRDGTLLSVAC